MSELDVIVDDGALLADRILRSLHRNTDGHLSGTAYNHESSIDPKHNIAVLQVYACEDEVYTLYEHYVHSPDPRSYGAWCKIVMMEVDALEKHGGKHFHGVYGWSTSTLHITPLRTGDLFIKVDKEGARGVRLAFGPRKVKHASRKKK